MVGDTGVGKSSLAIKYTSGNFNINQPSTSGAQFIKKNLTVDGKQLKFQIWDTAGQEKFMSLAPMYYRSAEIIILVFDVTRKESFKSLRKWMNALQNNKRDGSFIVLAGNKIDVDDRVVGRDEINEFCS